MNKRRASLPFAEQGPEFPGTYESQVSKTIRSLLLTNRFAREVCLSRLHGIPVPTVGRDCIVRFNPEHHVICMHAINCQSGVQSGHDSAGHSNAIQNWAKDDADLWSDLNFDIKHLAFMFHRSGRQRTLATFSVVFPGLEHVYGAVVDLPRRDPSKPLEVVLPSRQPIPPDFSPMFMYMVKRSWEMTGNSIFLQDGSMTSYKKFFTEAIMNAAVEGLVLV